MDVSYDDLYNRVLDVTAVIHMSLKIFTMFIVIKYTPKSHRCHSYLILHIMFWNFLCNLIFAFMHINPLFPAECFRQEELLSLLIYSQAFSHVMFFAEFTSLTHCAIAIAAAFAYRYIVFAYPHFAPKPSWVTMLCCGVHVILKVLLLPLGIQWPVSYDNYPEKAELPARKSVFCFSPFGHQKIVTLSSYLAFVIVFLVVVTVFSVLFLMKLRSEKPAFHPETIALQRKLFTSLVVITAITLIFGGIPYIICVVAACFPHLSYARYATMISIVLLTNHGSFYCVTYLVLFKAYRDAVKRIFFNFLGKEKQWNVKTTPVLSIVVNA